MAEWFKNRKFWEDAEPFLFSPERWQVAVDEADQLISLFDLEPGAAILDLCSGPGRHTLPLARHGFPVTAVDRFAKYLRELKTIAEQENLAVECVRQDMRRFIRTESYHLALLLFTSIGYFKDEREDEAVLKNIYQSLRPGGHLVLEMMGKEIANRIFQPRDWQECDGSFLLEERHPDKSWRFLENRWIFFREGRISEYRFRIRIFSAVELIDLLKRCGFGKIDVYGDFKKSVYDQQAARLVVVAER